MSNALEDLPHWDASTWYTEGDVVRVGTKVFTARPCPHPRRGDYIDVNIDVYPPDCVLFWMEDMTA